MFGPAYAGPREINYLFVDGAALHSQIEAISTKYFDGRTFEVDYRKLSGNHTKTFYYDAVPVRQPGETDEDYRTRTEARRQRHDVASRSHGVHVYEGNARKRRGRGYEQKKVDVMIAVDMLSHSFRRNMHQATLLTGDEDFKPLVDALVTDGMFVTLWYPPGKTSHELLESADARQILGFDSIRSILDEPSASAFVLPVVKLQVPIGMAAEGDFLKRAKDSAGIVYDLRGPNPFYTERGSGGRSGNSKGKRRRAP